MNVGEKIKQLRTEANITQEKLANYLNVSVPAVSKWERGETMPDIGLIVPISQYFGISIDDLFSYNKAKIEEDIKNKIEDYKKALSAHEYKKAKVLIFETYEKYPNNHLVINYYMWRLATDDIKENAEKILYFSEKILSECKNERIRLSAISLKARVYSALGNYRIASKTLSDFPSMFGEVHEFELEQILKYKSEDWYNQLCANIYNIFYLMVSKMIKLIISLDIPLLEKEIKLISFVDEISKTKYNSPLTKKIFSSIYSKLASEYVNENNLEKSIYYYDLLLSACKEYDNFISLGQNINNTTDGFKRIISAGKKEPSEVKRVLNYLSNGEELKSMRMSDEFKLLLKKYNE